MAMVDVEKRRAYDRARKRARPAGDMREYRLRCQYGMTVARYEEMLTAQGGCAICGTPLADGGHIDHDHACCPGPKSCGACVRAVLCGGCNRGLGQMKDDPARLRRAAEYLEVHRGN